jgi:predicted RNA binding protein YcfA (HicA-like mRNA interferase family)
MMVFEWDEGMPKKVRELKQMIRQVGYVVLPNRGKGSHVMWAHPLMDKKLVIPGKDGADAPQYLEKKVLAALARLAQIQKENES